MTALVSGTGNGGGGDIAGGAREAGTGGARGSVATTS